MLCHLKWPALLIGLRPATLLVSMRRLPHAAPTMFLPNLAGVDLVISNPRLAIWLLPNYRLLVRKCGGFLKILPILTRFLLMAPNAPRPLHGRFLLRCVILLDF